MATAREIDLVNADVDIQGRSHLHSEDGTRVYPISPAEAKGEKSSLEKDQFDNNTEAGDENELDYEGNVMIEPTPEEMATLRRVSDKIPIAAFSVVLVELCERFAYYGLSGPFQNYLANPLPDGSTTGAPPPGSGAPAGALNQKQTAATGLNNMFQFFAYITPILGAMIADSRWGRFKTIAVSCGIYILGLLIITLTSIPSALSRGAGFPGWIVGALIVACGTGGIKANVSPLVADQYRRSRPHIKVLKTGERVIVDPNVTITRIYNIFYWCINVGSLSSIATSESERNVGFWLAYMIPSCVFLFTPIVLLLSYRLYYKVPPKGSILVDCWKCVGAAYSGSGFWKNPFKKSGGDMWKYAKPSYYLTRRNEKGEELTAVEKKRASKITWDDEFVDELKRTIKACQIFLFFPLYWISYNQITTNLISMAGTMTLNGTPNDLIQNFDPIALIILIPVMDVVIYPALRRCGFVARPVFRIWLGFMFAALAMVYSAVLQHFIYKTSPCGNLPSDCDAGQSPLIVWIQIPPYVLIAISEIFASITGLEYAYNKAPKRMKSVVMSIFLFMTAIGNAINAALSPVAIDPKLVGNYAGIAITSFIAGMAFYLWFHKRDRVEEEENAIGKGKRIDDEVDDNTLHEHNV